MLYYFGIAIVRTHCFTAVFPMSIFFIAVFCSRSKPRGWGLANRMVLKSVLEALGFEQCRIFVMGADTVDRGVHDYFMSINIQLMELYGQSESSGCLTLNLMQRDGWKVESCGKPIEGVQLKIFNPDKNGEGEVSWEAIMPQ